MMVLNVIQEAWVKALKSGNYDQDTSYLHTDDGYCCLGVLCDIEAPDAWATETDGERGLFYYTDGEKENEGLPSSLIEKYGMNSAQGQLATTVFLYDGEYSLEAPEDPENMNYQSFETLAEMNDEGRTFTQIAEVIERWPEHVFKFGEDEKRVNDAVINTAQEG